MDFCGDYSSLSFETIKTKAVFSDIYRFFNTTIAIKSDREDMLGLFRRLHPRFRKENAHQAADATYYMMAGMPGMPGEYFVVAEENSHLKIRSVDDERSAMLYVYLLAGNYMSVNLKSHFLLHGAAVSRNGDGLAIMGPSYCGKTSLTLQLLLRKGFRFFSDDQLAINRTTHLIDPFPRGIGIREKTLAFFNELKLEHLESHMDSGGQRRWLVDISEISENDVGEPCRLKYLVILVNSLHKTEKGEQRIELILDDVNDRLLEKLRSIAKNGETHYRYTSSLHVVSFEPEAEVSSAIEFDHICENCGVWLLGMRELNNVKPDFNLMPQIQPISWHTAVMELFKRMQNDFRSTPGQAFMELAEILEGVECYKLSAGKLDEMGEHICNIMLN